MFTAADPNPATVAVSSTMHGDPSGLPEPARAKLAALRLARDDARAVFDAAQARVLELRAPDGELVVAQREVREYEDLDINQVQFRPGADQATDTAQFRARLDAAHDRLRRAEADLAAARDIERQRAGTWKALNALVGNLERWLAEKPGRFTPVPFEPPALFAGKAHAQGLTELRDLITALGGERRRVEQAALPAAEAKRRIRPWVERQAARVRVLDALNHDTGLDVSEPENNPALAYQCWLNPDAVVRRLEQEVDRQVTGRFALSELDKARRLKELGDQLLSAERREEALICIMADTGTTVLRRPAADPRAVLGLA